MAAGTKGKKTLMQQVFGVETMILLVGLGLVIYGVAEGIKVMQIFFGLCIILGSIALRLVRNKDWDAHWAEMDKIRQAHEARMEQESRMAQEREKKE